MKNKNLIYALAGLLHDIGKFGQRADGLYESSKLLSQESKEMARMLCNSSQSGYYTHQHVLWTYEFIRKFEKKFKNAGLWEAEETLINLASYHHRPSSLNQAIITLADHWSSGLDRNTERYLQPNPDYGRDKFRSTPLVSLFSSLSTETNRNGIESDMGYTLQSFNCTERTFPINAASINNKEEYKPLWDKFLNDFEKLPDGNPESFIFSIIHLLKIYTWYIPASTVDYPDNSLFEHLKTTGAMAECLSTYNEEVSNAFKDLGKNRIAVEDSHYPVMLFCGDISGIQPFIYNISNKSAMKGLKGRSFYVQLLAESIAKEVLQKTTCSSISQIYAAGGKFYLLLPNTNRVKMNLEEYKKQLESTLWEQHQGKLAVNMSWIGFNMKQRKNNVLSVFTEDEPELEKEVGDLWGKLAIKTSEQKKRRFQNVILKSYASFFEPQGKGGNVAVCSVSGEELNDQDIVQLNIEDIEQEGHDFSTSIVSKRVYNQIQIGKALYNAKYLADLIPGSDRGYKTGQETFWEISGSTMPHSVQNWITIDWDEQINLLPNGFTPHEDCGLGFRLYGGVRMASHKNGKSLKTLEELCLKENNSENVSADKLGVLRLDVDNLGNLFMNGFRGNESQPSRATFSALATLSALFDQFFSGYINRLRNSEKYASFVNIVYSGGDDVFAVGRWDKIIEFAIDLRNAFREYVCNREDISISGGVAIIHPKFPIAKGAEIAGELEDYAKANEFIIDSKIIEKNSLNLFGVSLNWKYEIPFVVSCKDDLVVWIFYKNFITKGFLMKMFEYYQLYLKKDESWKWKSAYSIKRLFKQNISVEQKEAIDSILNLLVTGNYRNKFQPISFDAFIAACRWAELEIKNLKS